MNEIQEKKFGFITKELLNMVKIIDKRINKISYEVKDNGEEFAEVHWLYSDNSGYRVRLRITGDNLKAIAENVLKHI